MQDDDLAEAARALAATLETASRGVIYEQRPQSLAGHRLYTAFRELLGRMGLEGSRRLEQDAALALRRVEVAAREVGKATATGPAACVEAIGRLVREAEAQQQSAAGPGTAAAAPGASLLIAP